MRGFNIKFNAKIVSILFTCLLIAILLASFIAITSIKSEDIANAETVTVNNLAELQAALQDANENTTIIVTECIGIAYQDAELDGHGATISVPEPFINADGTINDDASDFGVFYIDNGNVTLKNMTIIGGGIPSYFNGNSAIRVYNDSTITMENVTVTRSNRGIYASDSKLLCKNCNIVRNVADNGGGISAEFGSLVVLEGCSLSENRSADEAGGGGAMEINGYLFANNTVIANNSSSEIGGAINCYSGHLYLANCTITGNVTTGGLEYGGGIGYNSAQSSVIVNSIITDNYFFKVDNNTMTASDIGFYNNYGDISCINCVYGGITGYSSRVSPTDCKIDTSCKTAAGYREDGIMYTRDSDHKYTKDFNHPVLTTKTAGKPELYAPVKLTDGEAVSGGVKTYFDASNPTDVKIGYGEESSITKICGTVAPASSTKITTYYEGGSRVDGVIGASGAIDATFYTVKLVGTISHGAVVGASVYGDTYISGTEIALKGVPESGYALDYWTIDSESQQENPYYLTVTKDIEVSAAFDLGYDVTYNANGGKGTTSDSYIVGRTISLKGAADFGISREGYSFVEWNTAQDGTGTAYKNGDSYTVNNNAILYAQWQDAKVANTIELINSIGTVEYTDESKAKIDAARSAYDALDDSQKAQITNYGVLVDAEQTYAQKQAEANVHPEKGLNAGAVVGIVIAAIVALLCLAYVLLFFAFNKFIVKDGKVVRAFVIKKNDEDAMLITYMCAKETRSKEEIFNTQKDAEDSLNK